MGWEAERPGPSAFGEAPERRRIQAAARSEEPVDCAPSPVDPDTLVPDWDGTVLGRWDLADAVEGLVRRGARRWN